jgi:RNA polymerase sigma-70 factor, ECF subfamily
VTDANQQEAELIQRILQGNRELYHELIRPYERLVYLTACSILKDETEAEDASQEAILKAFRALGSFRGTSRFSTWLVSIVLNEARARLRKKERVLTESYEDQAEIQPALLTDWREIPSEALERKELIQQIEQAIDALPVHYREVFVLRDRDELRIDEIAGLLHITENLAKVRLHRARMMLQKVLAPYLKAAIHPRRRLPFMGGAL